MSVSFNKAFNDMAKDGVIDKNEYKKLKEIAKDPNIDPSEKETADKVIKNLSANENQDNVEISQENLKNMKLSGNFEPKGLIFTPKYAESDEVQGDTMEDKISNISQNDDIKETTSDDHRCGAASLINASLLMGDDFPTIAKNVGMNDSKMTYSNVHKAQDKLYTSSKSPNTKDGLGAGEISTAANKLNLKLTPLTGSTAEQFLKDNPKGVLQVGVHLDKETGEISAPSAGNEVNHAVIVYKKEGKFYMADTSVDKNGKGNAVRELSKEEVQSLVYKTSGMVNGVTKK